MIDLHTHTTASDGTLSPGNLIKTAVKCGVRLMSVTDHDTLSGLPEALEVSKDFALDLIPGIEISIDLAEDHVHVLGLFIDINNKALQTKLITLKKERTDRTVKMLEKLGEFGMNPGIEKVLEQAGGDSIGRLHIARAMAQKGFVKETQEAFDNYLKAGCPCYVPRAKINLKEAVQLILDANGIPVLAHPGLIENFSTLFPVILEAGIMGMEVFYSKHNPSQTDFFYKTALSNNLIITAGSDFHSPDKDGGIKLGMSGIPESVQNNLKDMFQKWIRGAKYYE